MTSLLLFKEYLKSFYNKYSSGIQPAVKFLFALAMFAALNMNLGYMTQLTNPLVVVLLCLVSAVLPYGAVVFLGGCSWHSLPLRFWHGCPTRCPCLWAWAGEWPR